MTEPTQESLDEAAKLSGWVAGWFDAKRFCQQATSIQSIRAHALTLDKLHDRKPVDAVLLAAREIVADMNSAVGAHNFASSVRGGQYDNAIEVKIAIAAIRRGMEMAKPVPVDDVALNEAIPSWSTSLGKILPVLRRNGFIITAASTTGENAAQNEVSVRSGKDLG